MPSQCLGCTQDQIVVARWQDPLRMHSELEDLRRSERGTQLVGKADGLQQGLDLVKTILPPTQYTQIKIDLRRRADSKSYIDATCIWWSTPTCELAREAKEVTNAKFRNPGEM